MSHIKLNRSAFWAIFGYEEHTLQDQQIARLEGEKRSSSDTTKCFVGYKSRTVVMREQLSALGKHQ